MAEKRENSVLFSLRELRQIEDDRVQQEEDDARQRDEETRRAQEEAERRAREDAERARREAEDAERRKVEEVERRAREEQLRLEEAERRARVEAQMKLEEQRLKMEIEAKTQMAAGMAKKPAWLMPAMGALVLVIVGLGVFLWKQNQAQQAQQREALLYNQQLEEQLAKIKRNEQEQAVLLAQIESADDTRKLELRAELDRKKREQKANQDEFERRKARGPAQASAKKPADDKPVVKKPKCADPNDPLCGL